MSEVCKATSATAVLSTSSAAELVRCVSNLPVLVVAGSKDNLVPIKTTQSLASQLPNSVCHSTSSMLTVANVGMMKRALSSFTFGHLMFFRLQLGSNPLPDDSAEACASTKLWSSTARRMSGCFTFSNDSFHD